MLRITNISISAEAAAILRQTRARIPLQPGDLFALVYMSKFASADGLTASRSRRQRR
jgi:hypothetical protein